MEATNFSFVPETYMLIQAVDSWYTTIHVRYERSIDAYNQWDLPVKTIKVLLHHILLEIKQRMGDFFLLAINLK